MAGLPTSDRRRFRAGSLLGAVALMLAAACGSAQSERTEHTLRLDDPDNRPAASIEDVGWLVGNWEGEAFGQSFEEVWNPPSGGSMAGFFKLMDGDDVGMYEMLVLLEDEGSLSLRVKHFTKDFIAWEDKEDYVEFKLVRIDPDAIHFSGLSFYRIDENRTDGYIAMRTDDGVREEKLTYRRRESD